MSNPNKTRKEQWHFKLALDLKNKEIQGVTVSGEGFMGRSGSYIGTSLGKKLGVDWGKNTKKKLFNIWKEYACQKLKPNKCH